MALSDTEKSSDWKCSKSAPCEEDTMDLVKELAELKRKERENDPEVKRIKNKYRLKSSVYPSPGNILHTQRQLLYSPVSGVLPLLPSQTCEPQELEDESFEQLRSFPVKKLDNVVPSGRQLPCIPFFTKPDQCNVLREIQPHANNVNSTQKLSRTVNPSVTCNVEAVTSDTSKDRANEIPVISTDIGAHKVMSLRDTERRTSGWKCSKTALCEEDAIQLLKEFAELKCKVRANDSGVKHVKNKYRLKSSVYPSPGNILHTGRQLPRSPGPGVLPLLPSQEFEPREPEDALFEQLRSLALKELDNIIPSGKQLSRTPLFSENEQFDVLRETPSYIENVNSSQKLSCTVNNSVLCNITEILSSKEDLNMTHTLKDLENKNPVSDGIAHKNFEVSAVPTSYTETTEGPTASSQQTRTNKRISELPVKGLNQMRISGVLKKMPGYECRTEDLEFLTYMKSQEKAKKLKEEFLCLRNDLAVTKQDKELLIARKEKIDEDIERMKLTYQRTVQLGRAFLSRTHDAESVQHLTPEDVLKHLNHLTIQGVHQQERVQLLATQKEVTRRKVVANVSKPVEDKKSLLISKIESYEKCVNTTKERIQRVNDEVITLRTGIEKTEKKKCELEERIQKKREQISQCLEQHSAPPSQIDMSEEDRDRMNRSLQRILYRKKLYLEREKILRKLKRDLK